MHVKLTNGQPTKFPYTVGDFRRDNPKTSFPKVIPDTILRRHGVFRVTELEKPSHDNLTQNLVRDTMPHKEIIRYLTEEDVTDPITGEVYSDSIGQPIYGNEWFIGFTVENKPQEEAERNVRSKRDNLIEETDWRFRSDMNPSQDWIDYCQTLRDIPQQEGFPYNVIWPTKPE